jgi:hypothetical protein
MLVCENILQEEDQVLSAIRIVDVFTIRKPKAVPADKIGASFIILIITKREQGVEVGDVRLRLQRPDGPAETVSPSIPFPHGEGVPQGNLLGYNIRIHFRLSAKQVGRHYLILTHNDTELTRTPLYLAVEEANDGYPLGDQVEGFPTSDIG